MIAMLFDAGPVKINERKTQYTKGGCVTALMNEGVWAQRRCTKTGTASGGMVKGKGKDKAGDWVRQRYVHM